MLKNYIKIAFRNLFRNKGFSLINIGGLAIGMASAILILLWVQNEISYDRFHEKNNRLYEVWGNSIYDGALQTGLATPQLMGPALKNDYPEIESATRSKLEYRHILFGYGDKHLKASGIWVDPSFLTMFSFPLLIGDAKTALNDPHSLVITEKMSKKLFGDENPMGKVVKFDNSENFIDHRPFERSSQQHSTSILNFWNPQHLWNLKVTWMQTGPMFPSELSYFLNPIPGWQK